MTRDVDREKINKWKNKWKGCKNHGVKWKWMNETKRLWSWSVFNWINKVKKYDGWIIIVRTLKSLNETKKRLNMASRLFFLHTSQ